MIITSSFYWMAAGKLIPNNPYSNLTYTRDDLFKKLSEVCKKLDITSYELDVKLSESLLKNFTMEEIRDQEIIMKVLNKILDKK